MFDSLINTANTRKVEVENKEYFIVGKHKYSNDLLVMDTDNRLLLWYEGYTSNIVYDLSKEWFVAQDYYYEITLTEKNVEPKEFARSLRDYSRLMLLEYQYNVINNMPRI